MSSTDRREKVLRSQRSCITMNRRSNRWARSIRWSVSSLKVCFCSSLLGVCVHNVLGNRQPPYCFKDFGILPKQGCKYIFEVHMFYHPPPLFLVNFFLIRFSRKGCATQAKNVQSFFLIQPLIFCNVECCKLIKGKKAYFLPHFTFFVIFST